MNSKIKVIKGGTRGSSNDLVGTMQKTERERERETADTVKNWITEWEERKRAVTELQGSYQVAVIGSGNRVEFRPVKVGGRIDSMSIIEDGLKAGETVIVEGIQKVKPGVVVNPKPFAGKPTSN